MRRDPQLGHRSRFIWTSLLSAFLLACGQWVGAQPAPVLRFFTSQVIGRVDPVTTQANFLQILSNNLYEQLVRYKTGSWDVVPGIADKWQVSSNGLTYTFAIRRNQKFHDGTPVTLNDVVFSLNRARSEGSVWRDNYATVAGVRADQPRNAVILTLTQRDPYILQKLASIGGSAIVPQATVERFGDRFGTIPESTIGAGPYRLVQKTDTQIVFERHADHFQPAKVERIVMRVIPDPRTQRLEFEAGNIDWIGSILEREFMDRLRNDPRFAKHYQEGPAPDAFWYGFNARVAPYSDVRVRQAVASTIDMEQAVRVLGIGRVSNGLIHPALPGFRQRSRILPRDIQKARALLQEAGYGGALEGTLYVWNIPAFVAMSESVVQQMNASGLFRMRLQVVEFGTFISEVRKGTYPFFINLGNIGVPDSAQWLFNFFHSRGTFNVQYKNGFVDEWLNRGIREADIQRRARLAAQAEERILRDAIAIPIANRVAATVFQPWVRGVEEYNATAGPGYIAVRWNDLSVERR